MEKYIGIVFIIVLALFTRLPAGQVKGVFQQPQETLPIQPVKTESSFIEKLEEFSEIIPRKTVYQDDPETEAGEEKVIEQGEDGKKTKIIKITLNKNGSEYERKTVSVDITDPKDRTISRGTKIVWRNLDTPTGQVQYWRVLRVYATHYDQHCPGCNEWTAIGMRAGYGVIAVDPSVIKLRTRVYIPGYGEAVAGDTGGAIKGNIIDLGFDDAKTSGWTAKFIDIYLL